MSSVHDLSFRQNSRALVLSSLDEHKWILGPDVLSHMFGNYPIFVELGGLLGLSYMLRTDTSGGLRDDEKEVGFATRKEIYSTNVLPRPPVHPFWEHALIALDDPLLIILLVSGVISVAANTPKHPGDG